MTSPSYARSRSRASTPSYRGSNVATFDSALGWMAESWVNGLLARLTFGHTSPQAAVRYLNLDQDPGPPLPAAASLIKRLCTFASGDRSDDFLDVPLLLEDKTPFQQAVIERCRRITAGETLSYAELAAAAGHPGAARAVGRVMATNRFPLIVPCHRVVAAGGRIGGFSAPDGINMKRRLLSCELSTGCDE